MVKIASFVFFDIETTGLPHQERNKTKMTELSFVVALRKDIEEASTGSKPYVSKLTLLFNPQKKICHDVTMLTGLCNSTLKNAPIFKDNVTTILAFLNDLPKPVCLVAHNGNRFDFKILLAEFLDINSSLPHDLLCVDSLTGFQRILKNRKSPELPNDKQDSSMTRDNSFTKDDSLLEEDSLARENSLVRENSLISEDSLISDDWPDLDVSTEDWQEIDSLCSSFSDMPIETSSSSKPVDECNNQGRNQATEKISYTLSSLYRKLLKTEVYNAHRAEDDCMMLLECVVATKEFLPWADKSCKSIHNVKPLDRKKYSK